MKLTVKLTVFALLLCAPLFAQNPPAAAVVADDDKPITLDVSRVNLLFTVTDKKGRFVNNLKKEDFQIMENKRKQSILEFTAETDLPLRLAILVDTSNSIRTRFRFLQDAAIEFINTAMRTGKDKALIMHFDTEAQLAVSLTGDKTTLVAAVRRMLAGGGTALNDAIYYSSQQLTKDEPHDQFRRAIIILSDGEDTLSQFSREQALEMAQKADCVIYTVSTNITHNATDGDKVLKHLAEQTGGLAYFPFKDEDLGQSFVNITNELRHQYNAVYRPEPMIRDGRFHPIDVKVTITGDYIVRARQGYIAPGGN
ncbi:MAG: VWA domain-containing protein [Acidobacteriota bacterium]